MNDSRYFLPYQLRWLNDDSKVKIWEKSRRIGATYVQSYEDVRDCAMKKVPQVWFSSADESAAREYILYCQKWTKLFNVAGKALGYNLLEDEKKDIKTFTIQFAHGPRITALSSNPKAFRSKGGKVVLDEFAHHEDQEALWTAARPCITWGFPLRIISTHNGMTCRFYRFITEVSKGLLKWASHKTPIQLAVEEGLVDKILGRKTTPEERAAWLENERSNCSDEFTWLQEYCCIPVDEATAFLTYEMIEKCEMAGVVKDLDETRGDLYVGMDVGRKKDLSVIWTLEKLDNYKFSRQVAILERATFQTQREFLFGILRRPNFRRCCMDATGLGMQLAEEAQTAFGKYRVEPITFTGKVKEDLAYNLRRQVEDVMVRTPPEAKIREDLHSVRKITTASGNIRFDVDGSDRLDGHADRFWALALALHAVQTNSGPITIASRGHLESETLFRGY